MQRDYRTAGFVRLCFEKLLPLMVLNLLFLLTCLPLCCLHIHTQHYT